MPERINAHCHLLNYDFIPDAFFKKRAPIREWMLRFRPTWWIARLLTYIQPGRKYDKIHEVLALLNKNIESVAEELIGEMDDSGIELATPLMMDISQVSAEQKPEIPYEEQVRLVSDVALKYPGRLMPFVMFDPRRKSALENIVKKSLSEMGFLGVKIYPMLGYDVDPDSHDNSQEANLELGRFYEYCESNKVPVTAHCTKDGAYSNDLLGNKELGNRFCSPAAWEKVLRLYPSLRLNLAHFGGDQDLMNVYEDWSWTRQIIGLMKKYENVYADVSYNDKALKDETSQGYFEILNMLMDDEVVRERVLFGTDWMMIRHTWTEQEYVDAFIGSFKEDALFKDIAFYNPMSFLFPEGKAPERIRRFYEANGKELPAWLSGS
ncbi:amidohydrolase [Candidatus Woesearchaeota archaeon]|nr:amidohydrolase [Candidatus Woesearchaeota archaeon]